ncbi:reverse transcriptase domain-containing protein [Tanacetum coccineum]
MIDVFNKKISFKVRNETMMFDIKKSMKFSTPEDDECLSVDLIDNVVSDLVKEIHPSTEKQPPKLKELPSHLEYAFLNNNQEFPVIISSLLNSLEKESLLKVLTQHKAALAWKVADIKGINPSFCTHKILMEDNFNPVVQPQRRLKPKVQDVVKAKIVKLLDSGLIYTISDSRSVIPIHVVPKKGEFTIEIKDKKGTENLDGDHLSRLKNPYLETLNEEAIRDSFPDEYLMEVHVRETAEDPWYADYANFLVSKIIPHGLTYHLRKKFLSDIKHYIWDDPYLFKSCPDGIIRRCVFGKELQEILEHCHMRPTRGHYRADITARKGIDFMGPFPSSRNKKYMLVAVDVSKWVEAEALPTNDAWVLVKFIRILFSRFGVPKALISDRGTHFCNSLLEKTLKKYGVTHRISTPYHPQISGQTKNTNRAIKCILERTANGNRKNG